MQKEDRENIEFTLLGNGLDFISSAVDYLAHNPKKRELKYAVLHLCSGIELILKERLQREHWSLIFEKPDSANKKDYEAGTFTSVSFDASLKRLKGICEIDISEKQRGELLAFRNKRNRMEHFNVVDSADAIKAATSEALSFLVDFINSELSPENFDQGEADMLDRIRRTLGEFEMFVSERWDAIKEDLEHANTAVVTCPSCEQNAAILDDGAHCLFCGYQQSAEKAAEEYISNILGSTYHSTIRDGGVWPLYWCPSCERETLVSRWNKYGGQFPEEEFVCFGCGEAWMEGMLRHCDFCDQPFVPMEDGQSICYECFEARVQADD